MHRFDDNWENDPLLEAVEEDESNEFFRDILTNSLMFFMVCLIIIIQFMNPPTNDKQADPPGNLIVHVSWPEGDTDVDVWLHSDLEPVPVGYSNKGGVLWNLLRDDLGNSPDATPLNYENAFTRGVVQGEYTINVHCYRCPVLPVPVDVEISINNMDDVKGTKSSSRILLTTQTILKMAGEEKTVINFKMDANGVVDQESMNSIHKPLRNAKKN